MTLYGRVERGLRSHRLAALQQKLAERDIGGGRLRARLATNQRRRYLAQQPLCRGVTPAVHERVMREVNGNKAKASRQLGISRTQLYMRLRKHGLEREHTSLNH